MYAALGWSPLYTIIDPKRVPAPTKALIAKNLRHGYMFTSPTTLCTGITNLLVHQFKLRQMAVPMHPPVEILEHYDSATVAKVREWHMADAVAHRLQHGGKLVFLSPGGKGTATRLYFHDGAMAARALHHILYTQHPEEAQRAEAAIAALKGTELIEIYRS
jgi:hypothetical protein